MLLAIDIEHRADIGDRAATRGARHDRRSPRQPATATGIACHRLYVGRSRIENFGPGIDRGHADIPVDPFGLVEWVIIIDARTQQARQRPRLTLAPQSVIAILHTGSRAEHQLPAAAHVGLKPCGRRFVQ